MTSSPRSLPHYAPDDADATAEDRLRAGFLSILERFIPRGTVPDRRRLLEEDCTEAATQLRRSIDRALLDGGRDGGPYT